MRTSGTRLISQHRARCGFMIDPDTLLAQSKALASSGAGRPVENDLRRAVSSAYYAVFHETTLCCARHILGACELRTSPCHELRRLYNHRTIKEVCVEITTGKSRIVRVEFRPLLCGSSDVMDFSDGFPDLMMARHNADYDHAFAFKKEAVQLQIAHAENLLGILRRISGTQAGKCLFYSISIACLS